MKRTSYPEWADEVEHRRAFTFASFTGNACDRMPTTGRDPGDDPLGAIRGLLTTLLIGIVLWFGFAWMIAKAFY